MQFKLDLSLGGTDLGDKAWPGKEAEAKEGNDAKKSLPGYKWTKGRLKNDIAPLWDTGQTTQIVFRV